MKFLILCENSNGTWPYLHYRGLGAFELQKRIKKHGFDATTLEWFTHWSTEQLVAYSSKFFSGTSNPVIAVSTPFDNRDLYKIEPFLRWAKNNYANLKIIHGGSRTYQETLGELIDVFFLGRSMEMLDRWIKGLPLDPYVVQKNPLVLMNRAFDEKIDSPVIPNIDDDDCLGSRDILGFEVGVGCKFNCTFCNYELRSAKITKFLDYKELHDFLDNAYRKYGVTNFYASDDTINESDEKLEVIVKGIENLPYKPIITAFARLDLFNKRPHQLDLIEKIQFGSLFFGIESFNPEASKFVRKRTGLIDNFATLKKIKERCPDTYTVGGLIAGLSGDSKESIIESIDRVVNEKLLKGLQMYPLILTKSDAISDEFFLSDLDKDPEKYGYRIVKTHSPLNGDREADILHWENDWIDYAGAGSLIEEIRSAYQNDFLWMNHYEYSGYRALGLLKPNRNVVEVQLKNQAYSISNHLKKTYIQDKIARLEL